LITKQTVDKIYELLAAEDERARKSDGSTSAIYV
jgi:hypothetical protein